jgi:deoxyribonuclease V
MVAKPWPETPEEVELVQRDLAARTPPLWHPMGAVRSVTGCFVCFPKGKKGAGERGDLGWAAAVLIQNQTMAAVAVANDLAPAGYTPGLLALREGPLLEAAVQSLPTVPEVLIVDATGRVHFRRAGLALHLGVRLELPSIGGTDRPLLASGPRPPDKHGAMSPLHIQDELVGYLVRTKRRVRPLAVHAGWRTDPETAVSVALSVTSKSRTPEPLRQARRVAREARAGKPPAMGPAIGGSPCDDVDPTLPPSGRRCHATLLLQHGVHPKVAQEHLGHSTISMTLDTYSHVAPGMQERAAADLEARLFGDRRLTEQQDASDEGATGIR